ncbi:MAG: hypothetical protein ACP5P1_12765 [Acidimicrobiales bacterium]
MAPFEDFEAGSGGFELRYGATVEGAGCAEAAQRCLAQRVEVRWVRPAGVDQLQCPGRALFRLQRCWFVEWIRRPARAST